VRANLAALDRGSGEIYVIGAGKQTSVNQVYAALVAATGIKAPVTRASRRPGDARDVYFNPVKALRELGWKAEVDLAAGMGETVAYFRERSFTAPA
jgi:UDP-glucose 4-epimerase